MRLSVQPGDDQEGIDWIFEDEDSKAQVSPEENWKIMIVDDEAEVHQVTKLVLRHFTYAGKGVEFISCYDVEQSKTQMKLHPDTAIILLDVVMEQEDSGLQFVKYVRNELKNNQVRIILRTGQPGQAPERQVVRDYDINDYKEKTELTTEKLYTSMFTSLRTYQLITEVDQSRKHIADIASELEQSNKLLEQKVKDKTAVLEEKNRQLRESMWETASALVEVSILEERNRIAKEIHDIAGHTLTGSIIQSEWIKAMITTDSEKAIHTIDLLQDHLRNRKNQLRESVHMLRDNERGVDFNSLLLRLIHDAQAKMGIEIEYAIDSLDGLNTDLKKVIFHAFQEGLTNGVRHGESTYFSFALSVTKEQIQFCLKDNGRGPAEVELGFGLSTMKEQVERFNGSFTFKATPIGCELSFQMPYASFEYERRLF